MIFVAVSQWDQKIPKALLMDFEDDEETLGENEVQNIKLLDKILIRLIKHIDDVTYAGMVFSFPFLFYFMFYWLYNKIETESCRARKKKPTVLSDLKISARYFFIFQKPC